MISCPVDTCGGGATAATDDNQSGAWIAAGFSVDPGQDFLLTGASVNQIQNTGATFSGEAVTGGIWSDVGGAPGVDLADLTITSPSLSPLDFAPTTSLDLVGGDSYFLMVTGSRNTFKWLGGDTSKPAPSGDYATYLGVVEGTGGAGLNPTALTDAAPFADFEIDGTPLSSGTPEPGGLALAAIGVVGIGAYRRLLRPRLK